MQKVCWKYFPSKLLLMEMLILTKLLKRKFENYHNFYIKKSLSRDMHKENNITVFDLISVHAIISTHWVLYGV